MKRILVIGHSHLGALAKNAPDDDFEFYDLRSNSLSDLAAKLHDDDSYESIVCVLRGNQYNIWGLVNYPQLFDFYLPTIPGLPINRQAEIVPVGLVAATFRRKLAVHFDELATIDGLSAHKIYAVETPPPIPSEDYIRMHAGAFECAINERGVSPAMFRYKLWCLQSQLIKKQADSLGIEYIPVPVQAQDVDGLLREDYWSGSTHANVAYGALVLEQIRSRHNRSGDLII